MTWVLFLDESGHDHKNMPFEVRGGIALPVSKLWSFAQAWRRLEERCFGALLGAFGKEAKGHKLLDKDRFGWAGQSEPFAEAERRVLARAFLERGRDKIPPTRAQFTGYGQASLRMAEGVFALLKRHDAKAFASLVPRGVTKPPGFARDGDLERPYVYLLERFFYFLDSADASGVLVIDQTEKSLDRKFVRRLERYFEATAPGRERARRIVPSPFFVSSDMSSAVQAADICLYCINWGYRRDGSQALTEREGVATLYRKGVQPLEWRGEGRRAGKRYRSTGFTLIENPYEVTT